MSRTHLFLVDVEAFGKTPVTGEMTEFGSVSMTNQGAIGEKFHGVLVEAGVDPKNPAVPVVTEESIRYDMSTVMDTFNQWITSELETFGSQRAVFVSDNPAFDFMWIACAFDKVGMLNPFGFSGRRISDFAAGLSGDWRKTGNWKSLRKTRHDHNPVNDSLGNAEALSAMLQSLQRKGK